MPLYIFLFTTVGQRKQRKRKSTTATIALIPGKSPKLARKALAKMLDQTTVVRDIGQVGSRNAIVLYDIEL